MTSGKIESDHPGRATSDRLRADLRDFIRCPACNAPGPHLENAELVRCGACDAAYAVDPESGICALTAAGSDSAVNTDIRAWWGDLYRQLYAENDAGLDSETLRRQLGELKDLFRRRHHLAATEMPLDDLGGRTILEIGSGAGGHSALFRHLGATVFAVDLTPERVLATARKLRLLSGETHAYQADAENLPFRDGCFDIVYANGVLHHAEDTERAIGEVHRVLKPGGRAVIMLYARHSATYWLNILPRAILSTEIFRRPEAQWVGRLTEGKPKFGTTKNPITRVYSACQIRDLFGDFSETAIRKSSFQFDNFCLPRLTQARNLILKAFGAKPHPGGVLVYGAPYMAETRLEMRLGRYLGFSWNIVARK